MATDIKFENESGEPRAWIGVNESGSGFLDLAGESGEHLAILGADSDKDCWLFMYDADGKPYASITAGGMSFRDKWPVYGYNRAHEYSLKWDGEYLHFIVDDKDVGILPNKDRISTLEKRIAALEKMRE